MKFPFFLCLFFFLDTAAQETLKVEWDVNFSCNDKASASYVVQTTGDGYVLAGKSKLQYIDFQDRTDILLFKVNREGKEVWNKSYQCGGKSWATAIIETKDKGLVVIGNKESFETGNTDIWLLKLNNNGDLEWEKTFEKKNLAKGNCVVETRDGGLLLVGQYSKEYNPNCPSESAGDADLWVLKTDSRGKVKWDKPLTQPRWDEATTVIQTAEKDFIIGGYTESKGYGKRDGWVIKLDSKGNRKWDKTFGGAYDDEVKSVIQTSDGQIALAGYTTRLDRRTREPQKRMWVIKMGQNGTKFWEKLPFKNQLAQVNAMIETDNGELVLVGDVASNITVKEKPFLVNLNYDGELMGYNILDTDLKSTIHHMIPTSDNGIALAGIIDEKMLLIKVPGSSDVLPLMQEENQKEKFEPQSTEQELYDERQVLQSNIDQLPSLFNYSEHLRKPNLHVLAIGTKPNDLHYTEKDANDFANAFRNQGSWLGGGNKLFGKINISTLLGSRDEANTSDIKKAFERLANQYQKGIIRKGDILIVFLASHGFLHKGEFRVQGNDFDPNAPKTYSISYQDMMSDLEGIDCKKLLFIDACHSGGARASVQAINEEIKRLSNVRSGLTVMVSSSKNQYSYEDRRWQNGAFTESLLRAFGGHADKNQDDIVTIKELIAYVNHHVPKMVRRRKNQLQHPKVLQNDLKGLAIYVVK